jgi:uncharacterized protein YjbI with pentapeptide repeats
VLTTWKLVAVGAGILVATVVPGVWLWWPRRGDAASRSDLGLALMTGTVVAFSVLVVQVLFDSRASQLEDLQRAAQSTRDRILQRHTEKQSLAVSIGMQRDLRDIDLHGRDLSGFILARKRLNRANLSWARLDKAFLAGSNLSGASLDGAHLHGAFLDDAKLVGTTLTRADLRGAYLRGAGLQGADLSGADLRGTELTDAMLRGAALGGARYDAKTKWPRRIRVRPCTGTAVCVVGAAALTAAN